MLPISAVVAVTPSWGIGKNGTLPWVAAGIRLPRDMAYFKEITTNASDGKQNAVLMGRRTWEGIPLANRPLIGRVNIVVTSNVDWAKDNLPEGVLRVESMQHAIESITTDPELASRIERLVVIGGSQLFEDAALHPSCDQYHLTCLDREFECDAFLSSHTQNALQALTPTSTSDSVVENGVEWRTKIFDIGAAFRLPEQGDSSA